MKNRKIKITGRTNLEVIVGVAAPRMVVAVV